MLWHRALIVLKIILNPLNPHRESRLNRRSIDSQISAKMGNEAVLRFGFMHVIATNLCIWVKTLMSEITLEAAYLSKNHTPQFQGNSPSEDWGNFHEYSIWFMPGFNEI